MKRRWFQIHLSTAMVLMFCAGGLLWLNVKKYVAWDYGESRGWPWVWSYRPLIIDSEAATIAIGMGKWETFPEWEFNVQNLVLNLAVSIFILTSIAVVMEFFLRRYRPE